MRRRVLASLVALLCLAGSGPLPARESDREVANFLETTEASQQKVELGLAFLARHQHPDGSIGSDDKEPEGGAGFKVAIPSLACLSFMANGNLPGRGKYGENVRLGLKYILFCAKRSTAGFITEPMGSRSRMHGHGYATMFLAEILGMTEGTALQGFKEVKQALIRAVAVIEESQTRYSKEYGGWGYEPSADMPDEASVTVTAVQALRAARNAGILVDSRVVDKAVEYVKRCFDPKEGSYRYSIAMNRSHSTLALTSAAVSCLNYLGEYEGEEVEKGMEYIVTHIRMLRGRNTGHYFYEAFYTSLATYNAGGTYWQTWCPQIREELVRTARSDGSWEGEYDNEYCTAFATLILQMPNRYLPIFQR